MRRSIITPDFKYERINGTLNMKESSNYFSSKMLEIEDEISIINQSIVYYQKNSGEQLDLDIEILSPNSYSSIENKYTNHSLIIDNKQSLTQKNGYTKYILDIDCKNLLINHIYALMKRYRTFEGIKNNTLYNNDVNESIKSYIKHNVLSRYRIKKIDIFLNYVSIIDSECNMYDNLFSSYNGFNRTSILTEQIISIEPLSRVEVKLNVDESKASCVFQQELKSTEHCFDYFFNIKWEKI